MEPLNGLIPEPWSFFCFDGTRNSAALYVGRGKSKEGPRVSNQWVSLRTLKLTATIEQSKDATRRRLDARGVKPQVENPSTLAGVGEQEVKVDLSYEKSIVGGHGLEGGGIDFPILFFLDLDVLVSFSFSQNHLPHSSLSVEAALFFLHHSPMSIRTDLKSSLEQPREGLSVHLQYVLLYVHGRAQDILFRCSGGKYFFLVWGDGESVQTLPIGFLRLPTTSNVDSRQGCILQLASYIRPATVPTCLNPFAEDT